VRGVQGRGQGDEAGGARDLREAAARGAGERVEQAGEERGRCE